MHILIQEPSPSRAANLKIIWSGTQLLSSSCRLIQSACKEGFHVEVPPRGRERFRFCLPPLFSLKYSHDDSMFGNFSSPDSERATKCLKTYINHKSVPWTGRRGYFSVCFLFSFWVQEPTDQCEKRNKRRGAEKKKQKTHRPAFGLDSMVWNN